MFCASQNPCPWQHSRRSQIRFINHKNYKQMEQKKNKGGRPRKTTDKKSKALTIRFTKTEYLRVKARKKKANFKSASGFVAHAALHNPIQQHFLHSDVEFVKDLAGMGSNLNQLAHQANISGVKSVEDAVLELIGQISEVVQTISRRL